MSLTFSNKTSIKKIQGKKDRKHGGGKWDGHEREDRSPTINFFRCKNIVQFVISPNYSMVSHQQRMGFQDSGHTIKPTDLEKVIIMSTRSTKHNSSVYSPSCREKEAHLICNIRPFKICRLSELFLHLLSKLVG